jgi:hypothetical protein
MAGSRNQLGLRQYWLAGPAEAAFDLRSLGDKAKTLHSSRKNWIVEASDVEQTARSEIDSYSDTQIKLI